MPADMFRIASQLTCPRQRPFRDPGTRAGYPASYPATATWRSSHERCGFLSAFAHRHSLLGHPVPASRIPPFLAVGLPGRRSGPDSVGVSAFRTCETRPGVGAFFTPGRRCRPGHRDLYDRRLPLLNGQPCSPTEAFHRRGWDYEACEDSLAFTRPAFPLPVIPGWNGDPSASTPGFAPHGHP